VINHEWLPDALRCIDGRSRYARQLGGAERLERELEALYILDRAHFYLNAFRRAP
jgi:hypothetical protein